MKTIVLPILLFLIAANTCFAQQKQFKADTTLAGKWYVQALRFYNQEKYDSAQVLFEKSAALYQKRQQWAQYVNCLNKTSMTLFALAKYEESLQNAQKTLQESQSRLIKEHSAEAETYHLIAKAYYEIGELEPALENTQKALKIYSKIFGEEHLYVADTYTTIGDVYFDESKYDPAIEYYHKALQIKLRLLGETHTEVARSYSSIAFVYRNKGDLDKALEYYQKSLQLWVRAVGEAHSEVGYTYNNIGIISYFKGEYDKALEYNTKGLSIRLKILGEEHPEVAASYNNRGSIFKAKGDYEKGIEFYGKALEIRRKVYGETHRMVAASYNNLGVGYYEKRDYDLAVEHYRKALDIWIKTLGEDHPDITFSYKNLANVYKDKGDYTNALAYNEKALAIERKSLGENHPSLASAYNDIGAIYQAKQEYSKALRQFQYAIMRNIPSFGDTLISQNPILTNSTYLNGFHLLNSLRLKAEVLEKLSNTSQTKADLVRAYQTYCTADTLTAQLLDTYTGEEDKVAFMSKAKGIYQSALRVCLRLHRLTQEQSYAEKAFYFSERGKASVLSSTLAESKARQFSGIADSLLQLDETLRREIANSKQLLAHEYANGLQADSSKLQEYQNSLFSSHRKQESLVKQLEKEYPRYHQLKYQSSLVTPSQLQSVLDAQTALIEYVLSDSLLQVFTLTQKTYQVHSVSLDSLFVRRLSAFRQAILSGDEDLYAQTAYPLYKTLFAQRLPASIKQLIVIPEGELTTLPFEALLTSTDSQKEKSYLLHKYAVSYAYSAGLLYERLQQKETTQAKHLLALAPVFEDSASNVLVASNRDLVGKQPDNAEKAPLAALAGMNGKALALRGWLSEGQYVSPLLASKGEVETIAALFEQKGYDAKVYLHGEAGEDKMKVKEMAAYNYVHIATHGFVNEQYPELSGLLFAQESASAEDGILYTGEIYNLALGAELVTLSACETGLGKLAQGEGIMGLTRALLYAGAKNVVVSFWKVPDSSTAGLMGYFYKAMLAGKSKTVALQEAKLEMLTHKEYHHPFFWAPFILVGK